MQKHYVQIGKNGMGENINASIQFVYGKNTRKI